MLEGGKLSQGTIFTPPEMNDDQDRLNTNRPLFIKVNVPDLNSD